jgi:hypothetical protein
MYLSIHLAFGKVISRTIAVDVMHKSGLTLLVLELFSVERYRLEYLVETRL